nr:hypothetical protein [uncultured Flavobacterium sp.]
MNKIITIIFCLNTIIGFSQSNSDNYKFSKDILSQIDKDTVAWKYQTGATELSFSGYYENVLEIWDKNGIKKPKSTAEDSLYFVNSKKINAKDYIIEQSKEAEIVIINEAHHVPKHRTFTTSLLKDLYNNGYRYIGLEALSDPSIHERKFATIESGYYTKEPEFGNLISEALQIGYTLFGYEASEGKNGKEREIEQAENIQKFIESVPNAKVLIHCGYAHAFENEYPTWGKAMAGRLKDNMNIDPLTIDQTMLLERSDRENNHLFMKLNEAKSPIVLIDDNGQVFNGKSDIKQTDIVIIHPETAYINNRPDWLLKEKKSYTIPSHIIKNNSPILVLAYRNTEFENDGIPADIIEIIDSKSPETLYLSDGIYTIVIKDKNYNIIENYITEIK